MSHRMLCPACADGWAQFVNPGCRCCGGHGLLVLADLERPDGPGMSPELRAMLVLEPRAVARVVQLVLDEAETYDRNSRPAAYHAFTKVLIDLGFVIPQPALPAAKSLIDPIPEHRERMETIAHNMVQQITGNDDVDDVHFVDPERPYDPHWDPPPRDELADRRRRRRA